MFTLAEGFMLGCVTATYDVNEVGKSTHKIFLGVMRTSVPDPPEPHVFGPPGSGSVSQKYGSGSFHHHAK
jgi:hypothetical protein